MKTGLRHCYTVVLDEDNVPSNCYMNLKCWINFMLKHMKIHKYTQNESQSRCGYQRSNTSEAILSPLYFEKQNILIKISNTKQAKLYDITISICLLQEAEVDVLCTACTYAVTLPFTRHPICKSERGNKCPLSHHHHFSRRMSMILICFGIQIALNATASDIVAFIEN